LISVAFGTRFTVTKSLAAFLVKAPPAGSRMEINRRKWK